MTSRTAQRSPTVGDARTRMGSLADVVGATPLIELRRVYPDAAVTLLAKWEGLNPGGSTKDRAALSMVEDGLRRGLLVPGESVVVESSSGNLAVGLAQVCRHRDLRFVCVVDAHTTAQHLAILRALGAEVEVVTTPDPRTGEYLPARLARVRELVEAIPGAYWPNQYANPANARAHEGTAREILDTLDGQLDYLFCATSSCGTLRGCADYLHRAGTGTRVVAVDAVGSVIFGGDPGRRLIPGHGAAVRPPLFHPGLADAVVRVTDLDCVGGCRRLAATEALLAGGSSGGVVAAFGKVRHQLPESSTCVLILPDRGDRYLDTVYSDAWVAHHLGHVPETINAQTGSVSC